MSKHDPLAIAEGLGPFDFHEIATFNDGALHMYFGDHLDASDWELHPDTDEFLMVLSGEVTVEILTTTGGERLRLGPGQFAIVPRGHWHRHLDIDNVVEMFYTPGDTVESTAADPRTA
ncbi:MULTISPECIES: cupin domain-containing protein [Tsukamurella]|uniref:Cupin domain-containing protein n=2 Tax=Tsukamurella TaxID=2060 RepID=A0A5C5S329_9ACTN|nr:MULTISPECIES: cupin domain-containing protein [Tsukamurella]NMD56184.1 cupin domain-containing protein [Tsukamurella columbiensis]TWS28721.1 cupin domain-containing protein [Tsukamurella conjunctivitidis]